MSRRGEIVAAAVAALATGCASGPRYLGEPLPAACRTDMMVCDAELQMRAQLDGIGRVDPALERYVQAVTARVARASTLGRVPRVLLTRTLLASAIGEDLGVGRMWLVLAGSEAEVAAVLAHEIAHLESRVGRPIYAGMPAALRRDFESAADERAAALVERAGYPASQLPVALARSLQDSIEDEEHPPLRTRVVRARLAAAGRAGGDDHREALLSAIDGAIAFRDLSRGARVGDAWVWAMRDLALDLPPGHPLEQDVDMTRWIDGAVTYYATPVGPRIRRELDRFVAFAPRQARIGRVLVGAPLPLARPPELEDRGSLARLLVELERRHFVFDPEAEIAVIDRPGGAVMITAQGPSAAAGLVRWLDRLRAPTAAEREATTSPRIRLVRAPRTATVAQLSTLCVDPEAARELDDPARVVPAGGRIKCTDRKRTLK